MMSAQPFLPLYFEEEDHDLWQVLVAIEPEKRARLVKVALRQVFLGEEALEGKALASGVESLGKDNAGEEDSDFGQPARDNIDTEDANSEFSLEDLFVSASPAISSNVAKAAGDDATANVQQMSYPSSAAESQDKAQLSPWENLLYNIIGTEDDQEVVAALRKLTHDALV